MAVSTEDTAIDSVILSIPWSAKSLRSWRVARILVVSTLTSETGAEDLRLAANPLARFSWMLANDCLNYKSLSCWAYSSSVKTLRPPAVGRSFLSLSLIFYMFLATSKAILIWSIDLVPAALVIVTRICMVLADWAITEAVFTGGIEDVSYKTWSTIFLSVLLIVYLALVASSIEVATNLKTSLAMLLAAIIALPSSEVSLI